MGKRAIVFGASGVTGWSFVNEILHDYPEKGVWVSGTDPNLLMMLNMLLLGWRSRHDQSAPEARRFVLASRC